MTTRVSTLVLMRIILLFWKGPLSTKTLVQYVLGLSVSVESNFLNYLTTKETPGRHCPSVTDVREWSPVEKTGGVHAHEVFLDRRRWRLLCVGMFLLDLCRNLVTKMTDMSKGSFFSFRSMDLLVSRVVHSHDVIRVVSPFVLDIRENFLQYKQLSVEPSGRTST